MKVSRFSKLVILLVLGFLFLTGVSWCNNNVKFIEISERLKEKSNKLLNFAQEYNSTTNYGISLIAKQSKEQVERLKYPTLSPDDEDQTDFSIDYSTIVTDVDCKKNIVISNQKQFDCLLFPGYLERIVNGLEEGDNINITFKGGTYYTDGQSISLKNVNKPSNSLYVKTEGDVRIINAKKDVFKTTKDNKGKYSVKYNTKYTVLSKFIDGKNIYQLSNSIYNNGHIYSIDEKITFSEDPYIVDADYGVEYKIKCNFPISDRSKEECKDMWMGRTQSYWIYEEKVSHISDGYIYFFSHSYNINEEYSTNKHYGRFYLINYDDTISNNEVLINNDRLYTQKRASLHQSTDSHLFIIENCLLNSFIVRDVHLTFGGMINCSNSSFTGALTIYNNEFTSCWRECTFESSDNIIVYSNTFKDCQGGVSYSNVNSIPGNTQKYASGKGSIEGCNCNNLCIVKNFLKNCGLYSSNSHLIEAHNTHNFYIADNIIEDFPYSAITVGDGVVTTPRGKDYGIIERNDISQTEQYRKNGINYLLGDGGPIYVYGKTTRTIIRRNYVHDVTGSHWYHGIYLDGATSNTFVYGNLVVGVNSLYPSQYAESIELQIFDWVAEKMPEYNTNNRCLYNIIDGDIRYLGRYDRTTLAGSNIFIMHGKRPEKNARGAVVEKDSYVEGSIDNGIVHIKENDYEALEFIIDDYLKQYIVTNSDNE